MLTLTLTAGSEFRTKIVENNPCKRSGACYFDRVLNRNHNLSVGPEGKGEQLPIQHTSGPSAFSPPSQTAARCIGHVRSTGIHPETDLWIPLKGSKSAQVGGESFSGLKVAEAAGSPVADATTNGDGLICPGVTKLKPVTGSSDGERLKSAAGPISSGGHTIGVRPPGQTEGDHMRQTVRVLSAFTRNSSPVGFTFKEPLIPNTEWVYAEYREARP